MAVHNTALSSIRAIIERARRRDDTKRRTKHTPQCLLFGHRNPKNMEAYKEQVYWNNKIREETPAEQHVALRTVRRAQQDAGLAEKGRKRFVKVTMPKLNLPEIKDDDGQ